MSKKSPSGALQENEDLYVLVYDELRRVAAAKMAREIPFSTLQATALVHEAWLRLGGDQQPQWKNRAHFYHAAATAMQRILIDRARKRKRVRHGGDKVRVHIDNFNKLADDDQGERQLLAINHALEKFSMDHPEKAELVKLRYFVGLTLAEAGDALNVSGRTVKRWWAFAKAWLYEEMSAHELP